MKRSVIALDIDDVLAAEAELVISYANKHLGGNYTLDDYTEAWNNFWHVSEQELEWRAVELHELGIKAIMLGDYGENRAAVVPPAVVCCATGKL